MNQKEFPELKNVMTDMKNVKRALTLEWIKKKRDFVS